MEQGEILWNRNIIRIQHVRGYPESFPHYFSARRAKHFFIILKIIKVERQVIKFFVTYQKSSSVADTYALKVPVPRKLVYPFLSLDW